MKKRKWVGSFTCRFSPVGETINHLFFTCRASVYVWSSISSSFGVLTRPTCFTQYYWWIAKFLHARTNMYVVGVAALGAGLFGKSEIRLVLKANSHHLLSKWYVTCAFFFDIGKDCNLRRIKKIYSRGSCQDTGDGAGDT